MTSQSFMTCSNWPKTNIGGSATPHPSFVAGPRPKDAPTTTAIDGRAQAPRRRCMQAWLASRNKSLEFILCLLQFRFVDKINREPVSLYRCDDLGCSQWPITQSHQQPLAQRLLSECRETLRIVRPQCHRKSW